MKKYLLDTATCIYIIKKSPAKVLNKLKRTHPSQIHISSITLAELEYGVFKSQFPEKNQMALLKLVSPIKILDFDDNAAVCYGEIRADLEKNGKIIGAMDLMIAAHAKSEEMILVTNNTKEFKRVSGIKIENWT